MSKARSLLVALLFSTLVVGPLSARAGDTRTPHADINISWNGELNRAHGIRSGHGTMADPYVISGWAVNNINIKDTDKAIKIVGNTITGTLTLNWVGMDIDVSNNTIGDLRVNENNARWGDPTSGKIMRNTFTTVGQLRHFDGVFAFNTVGAPQSGALSSSYPATRAVNFDGFNGAAFVHNTIYGYVDARLHGHHHGSAFGMPSHMHADGPHSMPVDHTRRYHEVVINDNSIFSSFDYALAYLDTDHAGNDRTANSETNPYLNAPHTHYTRAQILGNRLSGAGLLVNVFNAKDERHTGTPKGSLDIGMNRVTLVRDASHPLKVIQGIEVRAARYLALRIRSNIVNGPAPLIDVPQVPQTRTLLSQGTGILLNGLDHATVLIDNDQVTNRQIGIQAVQLTSSVRWTIKGLRTTDVQTPVSYDKTVANAPQH